MSRSQFSHLRAIIALDAHILQISNTSSLQLLLNFNLINRLFSDNFLYYSIQNFICILFYIVPLSILMRRELTVSSANSIWAGSHSSRSSILTAQRCYRMLFHRPANRQRGPCSFYLDRSIITY